MKKFVISENEKNDILSLYGIVNEQRKPRGFWDSEDNLRVAASEHTNLTDFQQKNQTAYNKAKKKGKKFFDEITKDYVKPRSTTPYTDEELEVIAKKYNTKKEFIEKENGAYQVALKRGRDFYEKITSHMEVLGSKTKRMVYAYIFPKSNSIYVGLTYNINERNKQHLVVDDNKKQTSVGKFIKETGEIPKLIELSEYIPVGDAQRKEGELVEKFSDEGYLILNKVRTGAVGKGEKYSNEELIDLLSQIHDYKDLYTKFYPLYRAAKRRGREFLDNITVHMVRKQTNWSEELVRELSKKYRTKTEFQEKYPGAAVFAKKHKFWDELFPKNPPTEEEIRSVAIQYNTQVEFAKENPSFFTQAKKLGILPTIMFKRSQKRSPTLKPEEVIIISKKYTTLTDFYKNDMVAYRRAMKLCKTLGNQFCEQVFSRLRETK